MFMQKHPCKMHKTKKCCVEKSRKALKYNEKKRKFFVTGEQNIDIYLCFPYNILP